MEQILAFLNEADKLKTVLRKTKVIHEDRLENSAEHSWHLALMAMLLAPYSAEPVDLLKVLKMLIVHDLVEIDAGDCLVYDLAGREAKQELEKGAADRLFGMLPEGVGKELRDLWDEFESQATPEARFAAAVDRIQPVFANLAWKGHTWLENGVTYEQVMTRNGFVKDVIPELWAALEPRLNDAKESGFMSPGQPTPSVSSQ